MNCTPFARQYSILDNKWGAAVFIVKPVYYSKFSFLGTNAYELYIFLPSFCVRPQAVQPTTTVEFGRELFRYDEKRDCYYCPNGKALELHGVGRSASAVTWQYQARREDCQSCPDWDRCLSKSHQNRGRKLERSMFHEVVQRDLARQNESDYLDALRKRQIWCEGTFAAQKWGHNLTRVLRQALEAAEDHCLLSATALNLKRMIRAMA